MGVFKEEFLKELKKKLDERRGTVVINRGITPLSLLGIALIALKVAGYITCSWWWVLAPFWIPVLLAFIVVAALIAIYMIIVSKTPAFVAEEEIITEKKKTRTKKVKKDDGTEPKGENG